MAVVLGGNRDKCDKQKQCGQGYCLHRLPWLVGPDELNVIILPEMKCSEYPGNVPVEGEELCSFAVIQLCGLPDGSLGVAG